MPKTGKRRGGMEMITEVPFRVIEYVDFPSTAGFGNAIREFDCIPANLGARVNAMKENFEFWRFKKLSVYSYTSLSAQITTNGALACRMWHAFIESNLSRSGTPTDEEDCSQYQEFKGGNGLQTIRTRIPRRILNANPLKWYDTTTTGDASDFTMSPGMFVFGLNVYGSTSTFVNAMNNVIEGIIEFRGMIAPTLALGKQVTPKVPSFVSVKNVEEDDDGSNISVAEIVADPSLLKRIAQVTKVLGKEVGSWGAVVPAMGKSEKP